MLRPWLQVQHEAKDVSACIPLTKMHASNLDHGDDYSKQQRHNLLHHLHEMLVHKFLDAVASYDKKQHAL